MRRREKRGAQRLGGVERFEHTRRKENLGLVIQRNWKVPGRHLSMCKPQYGTEGGHILIEEQSTQEGML